MAYSLTAMADELKYRTELQDPPRPISDDEYIRNALRGIKRLYVDTNRAAAYKNASLSEDPETGEVFFSEDLDIIEEEYALICGQISFLNWIKGKYAGIVGYSTDAITITNADKPYTNVKDALAGLENDRRITYYKMVKYTML